MAEIKRLLGTTRLLTLTGAGGCGKTRLALEVAADVLEDSKEEVSWVELAALSKSAFVPQAVAAALDVLEQPGRELIETLTDHLRPKALLLLLDNCEHLLESCAHLAERLLQACPYMRILVTSRESLGIAGELIYRVPSLALPNPWHIQKPEDLMRYESARLLVERATLNQPEFVLTQSNAPAIVQVCHRLDGIPLAIELAAARVRVLTVEQIAERLNDRFRLLTGGSRTVLSRHRTLRAAMDWSYDLLPQKERTILHRLSVFAGGCTLDAAEIVCSGKSIQGHEVLDLLAQLADKSLVVVETQSGEARYRLLETVRQYGRDRLEETEEAADVRRRHLDWYLGLAERAEPELRGPAQGIWLKRLETEHDNLRAALEWTKVETDCAEAGLRLAGALYRFWFLHGHWSEGRGWLEGALSATNDPAVPALPKALRGAAQLAWRQGDDGRATALAEKGLAVSRELGDREEIAWHHLALGTAVLQSDTGRAKALFENSLALSGELGDKWRVSMALAQLGFVARYEGDYEQAAAHYEKSHALSREVGDQWLIAHALRGLAGR